MIDDVFSDASVAFPEPVVREGPLLAACSPNAARSIVTLRSRSSLSADGFSHRKPPAHDARLAVSEERLKEQWLAPGRRECDPAESIPRAQSRRTMAKR